MKQEKETWMMKGAEDVCMSVMIMIMLKLVVIEGKVRTDDLEADYEFVGVLQSPKPDLLKFQHREKLVTEKWKNFNLR